MTVLNISTKNLADSQRISIESWLDVLSNRNTSIMDELAEKLEIAWLLRGQSRLDDFQNPFVFQILDLESNLRLEQSLGLLESKLHSFNNVTWMDTFLDAFLRLTQQLSCKSNNEIGSISVLVILNLGGHVDQVGSRVINIDLLKNS
jgi:hypothetical protein